MNSVPQDSNRSVEGGKSLAKHFLLVLFLALLLRFGAFPYTDVTSEGDSVPRTFIAWLWLEQPYFIGCAGWPPLHLYLIASSLWISFDPLRSPAVLHMLISIATAIPLWGFVRREWGENGGLFVAAAFLFYPLAWRLSFMPASEGAFAFFVAMALYFLSRARSRENYIDSMIAGFSMTIATGIRMEGWVLAPAFAVVLYGKWRILLTYIICASLFPVFCASHNIMNGLHPLSYSATLREWELNVEAINEGRDTREIIRRIIYFPMAIFFGLTPPVAFLSFAGVKFVLKDRSKRIWLVPATLMLLIFIVQVVRGLGATSARFSLLLGLLFLPFSAATIRKFTGKPYFNLLALLFIILMLPLSYSRSIWYTVVGPDRPNPFPPDFHALARVSEEVQEIAKIAEQNLAPEQGLLVDFFGKDFYQWKDTHSAALLSHTHPTSVFFIPGARYQELNTTALDQFLQKHPSGVLLHERTSRFIHLYQSNGSTIASVGKNRLLIRPVNSVKSITIYRYRFSKRIGSGPSLTQDTKTQKELDFRLQISECANAE